MPGWIKGSSNAVFRLGVDPAIVSTFLAEYLLKIVDKLHPREKSVPPRTINRDWRLCCHRSCKTFLANLRPTAQHEHNVAAGVALAPAAAHFNLQELNSRRLDWRTATSSV